MVYKVCEIQYRIFIFLIITVLVFSTSVHGQKEPQYTQYMYNIGSFNSAYVSTVETPEIVGLYRAQWIDIEGAPRIIRFGVNLPFKNKRAGLGFNIINDALGPTNHTFFNFSYSYQVNVSNHTKLSLGVDIGGAQLNVDYTKGTFRGSLSLDDTINRFYTTVGVGTFLYSNHWYLGLSTPNFLLNRDENLDAVALIDTRTQVNMIGAYVFNLSNVIKFKPAFLINFLQNSPLNINFSTNFLINNVFTIGTSYRWNNAVSALAGFQITEAMFLGYSYDYNTNGLGEFNSGSHEVILKYSFGKGKGNKKNKKNRIKLKQVDSPRFF